MSGCGAILSMSPTVRWGIEGLLDHQQGSCVHMYILTNTYLKPTLEEWAESIADGL